MNNRSAHPAPEKFPMRTGLRPPDPGVIDKRTLILADEHSRNRRILIMADSEVSAEIVGDALAANAYDVLATSDMHEALDFSVTHNPGLIMLMLSSLPAVCDAARQLKQHTSIRIIGFSPIPVTAAARNVALRSGCDDYRDAFLRSE